MLEVYPHYTGDGYGVEWYDPATGGWMHWAWDPLEAVAGLMEMVARSLEDRGEIGVYRHEIEDEQLLREVSDTLECLIVPGRGE